MRRRLFLAVVLAGGCGDRGGITFAPPDAAVPGDGGGLADTGGSRDAAATDDVAAAPPDAPPGPTDDARPDAPGPDLPPPPPGPQAWNRYVAQVDERETVYGVRQTECLHIPAEALRAFRADADPELARSLHAGRVRFDEVASAACLAALRAASCEDIARLVAQIGNDQPRRWSLPGFEPCGRILAGQVAPGEPCLVTDDCQSSDRFGCNFDDDTCTARCRPNGTFVRVGSDCSADSRQYCEPGLVCRPARFTEGPLTCFPGSGEGGDCLNDEDCAAGHFCQHATLASLEQTMLGACRRVQPGTPCLGSWACPRSFACVDAGTNAPAACRPGKGVGQPCAIQATHLDRTFSDCAYGLECADVDGKGLRCFGGNRLGQPCGRNWAAAGVTKPWCAEGYCDLAAGELATCHAPGGAGETCNGVEKTCAPPGECRVPAGSPGICIVPPKEQPLGGPCQGDDARECPVGSHCRPAPGLGPYGPGTCERFRKIGESCQGLWNACDNLTGCAERCEPLLRCKDGSCAACG